MTRRFACTLKVFITLPRLLAFCKYFVYPANMRRSRSEQPPRSHCPISLALEAVGDRWTLLVLRDLMLRRKTRYHEFLVSGEGISTNVLAERLARLEQQGLISKSIDPDDRRQFRYAPTEKALDLLPIIFEMARWSLKHSPKALRPDSDHPFYKRFRADEKGFTREILAQFRAPHGRESAARIR